MVKKDDNYSLRSSLRQFIRLVRELDNSSYYKKRLDDNAYKMLHIANVTPLETGAFVTKNIIEGLALTIDTEFLLGEALYYKDLKNYKDLSHYLEEIRDIFYGWYMNDKKKEKEK